jgi:type II secretory pathway component PulF
MPAFRYLAMSPKGERVSGELKAEALEGAIRELQGSGHVIISLTPREAAAEDTLSQRAAAAIHTLRTRVPLKDMVFFTRQLATMFSAGMTVERAVTGLTANEANVRLRKVLTDVGADLQKGRSLSDAMAKHPSSRRARPAAHWARPWSAWPITRNAAKRSAARSSRPSTTPPSS